MDEDCDYEFEETTLPERLAGTIWRLIKVTGRVTLRCLALVLWNRNHHWH